VPIVITISPDKFESLKRDLEQSQRNNNQIQSDFKKTRQRSKIHQQQLQDQLRIIRDSEDRVTQQHRETQATLDQAEVDLHTSQDQNTQLQQQQQQIDLIQQAADLQTAQAQTARDQAAQ